MLASSLYAAYGRLFHAWMVELRLSSETQMDSESLSRMGVENPERQVTKGEVAEYVARVIFEERKRLFEIFMDHSDREMQAEGIVRDPTFEDAILAWPDDK